jgi:hypothetical protein
MSLCLFELTSIGMIADQPLQSTTEIINYDRGNNKINQQHVLLLGDPNGAALVIKQLDALAAYWILFSYLPSLVKENRQDMLVPSLITRLESLSHGCDKSLHYLRYKNSDHVELFEKSLHMDSAHARKQDETVEHWLYNLIGKTIVMSHLSLLKHTDLFVSIVHSAHVSMTNSVTTHTKK